MPMDMCWKKMTSKMHQKTGKIPSLKNPVDTSENCKALTLPPTPTPSFCSLRPPLRHDVRYAEGIGVAFISTKKDPQHPWPMAWKIMRHTSFLYQKLMWSCWFPGNSKAISSMSSHQGLSKKSEARTNRLKVPLPYFGAPLCDLNYGRRFKLWSSGSLAGQRHPQVVRLWPCHKTRWPFLETVKATKSCHQKSRIGRRILGL